MFMPLIFKISMLLAMPADTFEIVDMCCKRLNKTPQEYVNETFKRYLDEHHILDQYEEQLICWLIEDALADQE